MAKAQKIRKSTIQKVNKKPSVSSSKKKGTRLRDSQLRAELDAGLMDMLQSTVEEKKEKERAAQHRKELKVAEEVQSKASHEELLRQLENMKNFGL